MPIDPFQRLRHALAQPAPPSSDYDLNPDFAVAEGRVLRDAAVLLAFQSGPRGAELLLTKRASHLRHHPGQIACPGGKMDPGDATPEAAALREAAEEIALPAANVEILGRLTPHETVTGFQVVPVLARVRTPFTPRAQPGEVAEIFAVPFDHIANLARYRVERRRWLGQWRYFYTVPLGPYYIWGATARILHNLAQRMDQP
ncbi:CoA pyrophosphatase [Roseicitreum antarcticum]|uniref:8-oxo-dGTP pyrophosphatase MutT, NUDIX family n=1 Tax=Roseicitreum antarcticum TaxID=564137 RepID=A0A1H2X2Q3_9RHOB|nr:CoA pyrophosphatase [Roseicitreum antarcticum]SDW87152.1 8-oxo-dGTP pyrophosphatase MutT, NUDIX family [Roseicitreum antarcticum]